MLWNLHEVESSRVPTLGVDKYWRLYYNREYIESLEVEELSTVLDHEIGHILRDHSGRGVNYPLEQQVSMGRWNIAGDCEINDDLMLDPKAKLPGDPAIPARWGMPNKLLAEEYMELMPDEVGKPEQGECSHQPSKPGDEQGQGKACPDCQAKSSPGTGSDCGSIAGGQARDWELGEPSEKHPGVTPIEGELYRKMVADEIIREASQGRGDIPGSLLRWAKKFITPQINWKAELRASVSNAIAEAKGRSDYTFRRPARRQLSDVKLPGMVEPIPNIGIETDTSGSMGTNMIAQALTEIDGVLKATGIRDGIVHFSCDAAVGGLQTIRGASQINLVGGGGTDLGVGIEYAKTLRPRLDILIVITDGYTPWPKIAPPFKTIVVILDGHCDGPAWAKTIKIKPEELRT